MAGFTQARRQRIIDDYLAASGANVFRPGEFIDWLADKPDHEAYAAFYSIDDEEAARAYRIELARRFVSGLRITVTSQFEDTESKVVTIRTSEAPSFVSPLDGRRSGGGYVAYDPDDAESVAAFRVEAAQSLLAWKRRYESTLTRAEQVHLNALLVAMQEEIVVPA
jgi:hypothetical protein